jgi:NADPH-dependent F420 reductase
MRVAILGGTGPFGRALAARLAEAGDDVIVGSRDEERARATAAELRVRGLMNDAAAAEAELVVLAVVAGAAVETATELAASLRGRPLLSVASELSFSAGAARPPGGATSLAERVAAVVDTSVVAGLHSLAAGKLAEKPPDEDAFVCGDDAEAKALALELAGRLVAGRALDAGPLECARALEAMTSVIVNVNRRYKGHAGIRLTGLP